MSTTIDQKAYLQKYLGGPSKDKKKKKKKVVKGKGFKIIDDDIDLTKLRPLEGDELDILDEGEDAPQIAGIVDERPEELKKLEQFGTGSKWRVINQDDGFNSKLQIQEIKKDVKEIEKENEIIFGKMYSDSEDEKQKNDSDLSPPRKKKSKSHSNDSDFSPPRKKDQKNDTNDSDPSPPRKRNESPKNKETKYDSDPSPPRKQERKRDRGRKPSRWGNASPETVNNSPQRNKSKSNRSHSDESPPRKKNHGSDQSPPRKRNSSPNSSKKAWSPSPNLSFPRNNDRRKLSPVRKHGNSTDSYNKNNERYSRIDRDKREMSNRNVSERRRQDSDLDLSPHRSGKDRSKTKSQRSSSQSDSDLSPPRKGKDKRPSKRSPENKRKYNSDSDPSPPRKIKDKNDRDRKMLDRDRNMSDHARNIVDRDRNQSDRDRNTSDRERNMSDHARNVVDRERNLSNRERNTTNKERNMSDRARNVEDRDRNLSDRDRNLYDRDRNLSDRDRNKPGRNSDSPPPTNKKMDKTLEGKQAGLQDARQLREENEEFRRKEDEVFNRLADDVSGRNAKAVSRKGKRESSADRQKQKDKAERQKELDAKYKIWSKGVKQLEAQEARIQDFMHEAAKPLARHKGDRDLEHSLKQVERAGDPMLQYIRERKRERGEMAPEKPSYKGNWPPNRFNIRPGYRWDGVDRSSGYENKYFQHQSKRKAQEEEAYKWSTEDL